MTFALSGSTITQTVTDTSLSGLSAIAGVTTTTFAGGYSRYALGTLRLVVPGALTIGGSTAPGEQLVIGQDAASSTAPDIDVVSGGVLTLGRQYTAGGVTGIAGVNKLIYEPGANKGYGESSAYPTNPQGSFLRVRSGATLKWLSGSIDCWGGIIFEAGSTVVIGFEGMKQKPILDMMRAYRLNEFSASQVLYQMGVSMTMHGLVVFGSLVDGDASRTGLGWAVGANATKFSGYEPYYCKSIFTMSSLTPAGTYRMENVGDVGSSYLGSGGNSLTAGATIFDFINYESGSAFSWYSIGGRNFAARAKKAITISAKDTAGVLVPDTSVYVIGKDGTQQVLAASGGQTAVTEVLLRNIVGTAVAAGGSPQVNNYYSKNADNTDLFDIYCLSYGKQITSRTEVLKGIGTLSLAQEMKADANITKTRTQALALLGSVIEIDAATNTLKVKANCTLSDIYDAASAFKTNGVMANMEYPSIGVLPVIASGTQLITNMAILVEGASVVTSDSKFNSIKTTSTFAFAATGSVSGVAVEDISGVRVTVRKSGGGVFNIAARKGVTGAYTDLGFLQSASSVTYTVPKGSPVEIVALADGCVTYTRLIDTSAGGFLLDMEMTANPSINTSLDVSSYLQNISLSLDTSGAYPVFVITFNAAMTISGIELGKAIIHKLVGQEVALRSGFPPGSQSTIDINSDEITNNLPAVRLDVGGAVPVNGRVYLDFFVNTAAAAALNPAYVINPQRADGNQVQMLRVKPSIDPSQMSTAVWTAGSRTLTALASGGVTLAEIEASTVLAKQSTLAALASTNEAEHDATQAAIAALPTADQAASATKDKLEAAGGKLDKAMKAAQAAEDQTV